MLRRLILVLGGCAMAAACGASRTSTGLTQDFVEAGRAAYSYMKSDLIPAIGTARFPDVIAASRARVKLVQSKVAAQADEGVWLILTMINAKVNESNGAREMAGLVQPSRAAREAAEDLANEQEHCMSEADGWLNGTLSLRILKTGPCLQQATRAMAVLTKK